MKSRKNPPLRQGSGTGMRTVQTAQKAGGTEQTSQENESAIKVDPEQVANDITTAAIGAVAGGIATRMIFGDG